MHLNKSIDFLIRLKVNNERQWFKENENLYKEAKNEFEGFVEKLIPELKQLDGSIDVNTAKECVFRIFRDVRFSGNKEPYKNNFGAYISKGGRKSVYAGYYVHFEPDESFLGGGIYMPESQYLLALRTAIFKNPEKYMGIIEKKNFKKIFSEIFGEKLKTAPKGFPKDSPHIDLIKNKHFAVSHPVGNEFWLTGDPVKKAMEVFGVQYEFNSFLNDIVSEVK